MEKLARSATHLLWKTLAKRTSQSLGVPENALASQQKLFRKLKSNLSGTEICNHLNLKSLDSYEDYVTNTPLQTYESYEDFNKKISEGKELVLFRDACHAFVQTSGTTGYLNKLIPYNRSMIDAAVRYQYKVAAALAAHCPSIDPLFDDRFSYATIMRNSDKNFGKIPKANASELFSTRTKPLFGNTRQILTPAVLDAPTWEQKLANIDRAVGQRNVGFALGIPLYLVQIFEHLLKARGAKDLKSLWPNFQALFYSGSAIEAFRDQIDSLAGRKLTYMGGYISSEGAFGIPHGTDGTLLFNADEFLYSFRPLDLQPSGTPRVDKLVGIEALKKGQECEIFVGCPNGFLQYQIGDIVRIESTEPLLTFRVLGRSQSLNVANEKTSQAKFDEAWGLIRSQFGSSLKHYFVYPSKGVSDRPHYQFEIVSEKSEDADLDATSIAQAWDQALIEIAPDYRDCRVSDGIIGPAQARFLPPGLLEDLFLINQDRGQYKLKSVYRSEEDFEKALLPLSAKWELDLIRNKPLQHLDMSVRNKVSERHFALTLFLMGFLFLFQSAVSFAGSLSQITCSQRAGWESVPHKVCEFRENETSTPVSLSFLHLKGSFADTARTHGRLLGPEMSTGVIAYVKAGKKRFLDSLPPNQKPLFEKLTSCFVRKMVNSADPEFLRTHKNLALGLRESGHPEFSDDDVLEMSLATELGVVVSGLQRKIKKNAALGYAEVIAHCGKDLIGSEAMFREPPGPSLPFGRAFEELMQRNDLSQAFATMGCTGIASSPGSTTDGNLWMSRNLDGSAIGFFDKHPIVVLHEPTAVEKKFRYVGVGSAGLHYVGGNSGFNEKGLGATLHEMETENYKLVFPRKNGLSGVYLQNRILERASNIDEAWKIIQETGSYTAWTIIVTDAKTGEVASFELSGDKAVVRSRKSTGYHPQTNHFQDPRMRDQFYNYSYNKVLESRFRLNRLIDLLGQESLGQAPLGQELLGQEPLGQEPLAQKLSPQKMINLLSEHWDWHQGRRSFGRNLIKTNTIMTQVFSPGLHTMITSLGDRYPVGQGHFLSFAVNFDSTETGQHAFPLNEILKSENPTSGSGPFWKEALSNYVNAYLKYKVNSQNLDVLLESQKLVKDAAESAAREGHQDFAFWYILGKLQIKGASLAHAQGNTLLAKEQIEKSLGSFQNLFEKVIDAPMDASTKGVHPYDLALSLVWRARAQMMKGELNGSDPSFVDKSLHPDLNRAYILLLGLLKGERQGFELQQFQETILSKSGQLSPYTLLEGAKMNIDFVTVE